MLSAPAQHGHMSQLNRVWVYVVLLHMMRITIPECVVLLDLARVRLEYSLEKKKGAVNEEFSASACSRRRRPG